MDRTTKDFLPDNGKGGLIVYDDKTPVCAGFIYRQIFMAKG